MSQQYRPFESSAALSLFNLVKHTCEKETPEEKEEHAAGQAAEAEYCASLMENQEPDNMSSILRIFNLEPSEQSADDEPLSDLELCLEKERGVEIIELYNIFSMCINAIIVVVAVVLLVYCVLQMSCFKKTCNMQACRFGALLAALVIVNYTIPFVDLYIFQVNPEGYQGWYYCHEKK